MKRETDEKDVELGLTEDSPFEKVTEEQLQREVQEIRKKREEYQKKQKEEVLAIRKEMKSARRHRMISFAKVAMVVLVTGSCLFAFSMQSEATRMWWLQKVERVIGGESEHVVNNDNNRVISETPEEQAVVEIEEKTGIPMPELSYKPAGMFFDSYDYGNVSKRGSLNYLYGEYVIVLDACSADSDATYAKSYDGEVLSEESVETEYSSVKIKKLKADGDKEATSVAQWTYHNHQYLIEGKLPFEELKKIIENILY